MADNPDMAYLDPQTGERFPLDTELWCSPSGAPFMLTDLPGMAREQIDRLTPSLWRYRAALPVPIEAPVSLGEGRTPLVEGHYDGRPCRFKLEWFSPTGSFKDRGASVMLSFMKAQGARDVVEDSSGNGGAAVAAYGAAAGLNVTILVPASTQPSKIAQIRAYGAEIMMVEGPREASEAKAMEMAARVPYAGHNWHPFFLQGTKTLGYEIWEDLDFTLPDNIVVPAGAGSNLLGCHLAFGELMRIGETDRMPRLFISQPENCAPVHAAFQAGADGPVETRILRTVAEGTAIAKPVRLGPMLRALRETKGGTVAVSEEAIIAAARRLASEGFYVEPTCAHAAAGFAMLCDQGAIKESETTVVVLTGTGLKATSFYAGLFN